MSDKFFLSSFFFNLFCLLLVIDGSLPDKLLVIAQSGRMLAQMAVAAGYAPVVIDCFADTDTRQLALATFKVPTLSLAGIRPLLAAVSDRYGLTHAVYGSGFERFTDTLAFIEEGWVMLGNTSSTVKRLQDKLAFFRCLDNLNIRYPETLFKPPVCDGDWLVKPYCGEGGRDIQYFRPETGVKYMDCYWQRYIDGEAMSLTFVAGRNGVTPLGFNRQWTAPFEGRRNWLFAGIANHADIPVTDKKRILLWLKQLHTVYCFRGAGSLDFILASDGCYVLEVNARMPASAQLYGPTVFDRHLRVCRGFYDEAEVPQSTPLAYLIVYASADTQIPDSVCWPNWVMDRPDCGVIIGKGEAICSIIAAGKSTGQVCERLRRRQQLIENILKGFYKHALSGKCQ